MKKILFVILVLLLGSCSKEDSDIPNNAPAFILDMIQEIKSENVWNPPAQIWQYYYNGKIAYYIPPRCCDIPGKLFNEDGNLICNTDGGYTGNGDGGCIDFFDNRLDGNLIWKDKRTYP